MDNTREKLIELIEQKYYCSIEELADHLIANGVTLATDNYIGQTVYALFYRGKRKGTNGKNRTSNYQIRTKSNLEFVRFRGGSIEIREKKCTKSDANLLGRLVFKTMEEAERVIADG